MLPRRRRPGGLARLALASLLAGVPAMGACGGGHGAASTRAVPADAGAGSSTAAVDRFVAAAGSGDVRTMGLLFGTAAGPVAARDPEIDVEKRMRALACYLSHDGARIVDDLPGTGGGGRRQVVVALRQGDLARETRFTTVPGPRGRWYVESFDIERLSDFCRPR